VGRKSAVDRLPKKLRDKLLEMLRDPACTQARIIEAINAEAGEKTLSAGSLCRFAQKQRAFELDALRARSIAESFIEAHGDGTRNKIGKLVNEQIRVAAYDLMLDIRKIREEPEIDAKAITDILLKVSKTLRETEQAEKLNAERSAGIRKDALADAEQAVEKGCAKAGVTAEAMDIIKKQFIGL